jgi:hypothetical protein
MKRVGVAMAAAGIVSLVIGLALFGAAILGEFSSRTVLRLPLELGTEARTDVVAVDTSQRCQVGVRIDMKTLSVQEVREQDQTKYEGRYRFPVNYRVLDTGGNVMVSQTCDAAWDSSGYRSTTDAKVTSTSGTAVVENAFKKFAVGPPGRISVAIKVDPDTTYGAEARRATLILYDRVPKVYRSEGATMGGLATCCLSPVLFLAGIALVFKGVIAERRGDGDEDEMA